MRQHSRRTDKYIKKILNQPILYIVLLLAAVAAYIIGTVDIKSYFSGVNGNTIEVPDGCITVHHIDVGQGDATLILTDSGAVLIDAGTTESGDKVATYIKNRTDGLDYMILTHPHEDHIGGASKVIDEVPVDTVIMPDKTADSSAFDRLLDSIEKSDSKVVPAERRLGFALGELRMEILSPHGDLENEDANNVSVVTRITFGETSFLFTGDAEKAVEEDLLESGQNLNCDVLKVGHHGSSTSSCEDFIRAVSPEIAVISCGKDNSYGHPHTEVMDLLKKYNITSYRTDRDGTIVLTSDGKKITKN